MPGIHNGCPALRFNLVAVKEFREASRFQKLAYMIFRSAPVLFLIGPMFYIFYNNRFPIIRLKGWEVANRALLWNNLLLIVPNYELARCHHENPVFDQVANALTFTQSLRCVFNKLWDEEGEKMVTWREYFRMQKMKA